MSYLVIFAQFYFCKIMRLFSHPILRRDTASLASTEETPLIYIVVMNLVATHYNCTSPMDYISHHALHTHIPVHHYTNHTAVTIHSLVLIASPHLHLILTLTFKQHSHLHSLRSLVLPWLTFPSIFPCVYYLDC